MKLTKLIREAFVRSAMNDVPKGEDYEAQAHKLIVEDSIEKLPAKVRALARDKDLQHFLRTNNQWLYDVSFGSLTVFCGRGDSYAMSDAVKAQVLGLDEKKKAEDQARSELRQKLMGVAMSCTTRKALVDMLPEFEKYLPADEAAACRTVPVIANLVADFSKAGWPATKETKK